MIVWSATHQAADGQIYSASAHQQGWLGRIGEAGYLTVTLAVGAGFGLSAQAGQNAIKFMALGETK